MSPTEGRDPSPSRDEPVHSWKGAIGHALRDTLSYAAIVIGVISGYFGLKTAGAGAITLRIVAAAALLALVGRLIYGFFIELLAVSRRELKGKDETIASLRLEVADLRIGFDGWQARYGSAIERLVDHQSLLYREKLEVVVTIGEDNYGDLITEKHITTPTPYLFYRSLRPVVPRTTLIPLTYNDLRLRAEMTDDSGIRLTPLPLSESPQGIRVLILFEPPARADVGWQLEYRSAALWEPLRRTGIDSLAWDARSPTGRPGETTFTSFAMRFIFPVGAKNMRVQEKNDLGKTERWVDDEQRTVILWKDESPNGGRYEWTLTMSPDEG